MQYLSLKIFKDSKLIKTKIFTDDQISIGSSEGLNLQLEGLSPWHVLIEKKHDIFCILDLNSETGTRLNGGQITDETALSSGSIIHIGPYEIHFFVGPPTGKSKELKSPSQQTTPSVPEFQEPVSGPSVPSPQEPVSGPSAPSPQEPVSGPSVPSPQEPVSGPSAPSPQEPVSGPSVPSPQEPVSGPSAPSPQEPVSGPSVPSPQEPVSGPSVPSPQEPVSGSSAPSPQEPVSGPSAPSPQEPVSGPSAPSPQEPVSGPSVPSPQEPVSGPSVPSPQEPVSGPSAPQFSSLSKSSVSSSYLKPVRKPNKKGFWNTYAPLSRIKNLDNYLEPSVGNLIEVNICWKERILKSHYFFQSGDIFMGGGKDCQLQFPNMQNQASYKLLTISAGAQIYLSGAVKGVLFQGKDKSTRVSHALKGNQSVVLKPYEMVRLDFNTDLKLYIRLMDKPPTPALTGLLNLRVSEALALLFALLLTGLLFFYGTLYSPSFLAEDKPFIQKDIRVAQVIFNKKPEKRKIVKYDLKDKNVKAVPIRKKPKKKPRIKKRAIKTPIKKPVKKLKTPKKGKQGKIAAVAKGRGKPTKKIKVGSSRPGGSIKTGKAGSSAKTVAPDPTKMGVLGILGGGGAMDKLDKGASGPGGLVGLADQYSGTAGTKDSYGGKGLGTKTKELASGRGSAIQGIAGIKTTGKGLGIAGSGRGGLGERGRMSIEFSAEDIDVTGEIDRNAILRVIKRNQNKFQRCYQLSLNQKASLQGNLTMKWLISANGRGRNARAVRSDLDSRALKNCMAGVLESLTFPAPPSGQIPDVRFTFRFYL